LRKQVAVGVVANLYLGVELSVLSKKRPYTHIVMKGKLFARVKPVDNFLRNESWTCHRVEKVKVGQPCPNWCKPEKQDIGQK